MPAIRDSRSEFDRLVRRIQDLKLEVDELRAKTGATLELEATERALDRLRWYEPAAGTHGSPKRFRPNESLMMRGRVPGCAEMLVGPERDLLERGDECVTTIRQGVRHDHRRAFVNGSLDEPGSGEVGKSIG